MIFWSLPSAHEIILKFTFLERASPHSISKQAYFISISEQCKWRYNALKYKVMIPCNSFLLLPVNLPNYLWSSYKFSKLQNCKIKFHLLYSLWRSIPATLKNKIYKNAIKTQWKCNQWINGAIGRLVSEEFPSLTW